MIVWYIILVPTLNEVRLNTVQVRQLVELLAELHTYGEEIPEPTQGLREDYTLAFENKLTAFVRGEGIPAKLYGALRSHAEMLCKKLDAAKKLAGDLRKMAPRCVLYHTDVHGWNLMWADELILIDWEGLRLAPAEADLFSQ